MQAYTLVGIIVETIEEMVLDLAIHSFPSFAGVLAARQLMIFDDPLHVMYEKSYEFVFKASTWKLEKMPSLWVKRVLLEPPSADETYHEEVAWLLHALLDGLRTYAVSIAYLSKK